MTPYESVRVKTEEQDKRYFLGTSERVSMPTTNGTRHVNIFGILLALALTEACQIATKYKYESSVYCHICDCENEVSRFNLKVTRNKHIEQFSKFLF